jgi:hypothetical protein
MTQTNQSALKYSADGCGWNDGFAGFYLVLGVPEHVRKKQEAEQKFQQAEQQRKAAVIALLDEFLEQNATYARKLQELQQEYSRKTQEAEQKSQEAAQQRSDDLTAAIMANTRKNQGSLFSKFSPEAEHLALDGRETLEVTEIVPLAIDSMEVEELPPVIEKVEDLGQIKKGEEEKRDKIHPATDQVEDTFLFDKIPQPHLSESLVVMHLQELVEPSQEEENLCAERENLKFEFRYMKCGKQNWKAPHQRGLCACRTLYERAEHL